MTRIHVSHDGYLTRIKAVLTQKSEVYFGRFVCYGRLVCPNGNYADAPRVALYETGAGFVALL